MFDEGVGASLEGQLPTEEVKNPYEKFVAPEGDVPEARRPNKPPVWHDDKRSVERVARAMNSKELVHLGERIFEAQTKEELLEIRKRLIGQLDFYTEKWKVAKAEVRKWAAKKREVRKTLGDWAPSRIRASLKRASVRELLIRFLEKNGGPLHIKALVELTKQARKRFTSSAGKRTYEAVFSAIRANPQTFVRVGYGQYDLRQRYLERVMLEDAEHESAKKFVDSVANDLILDGAHEHRSEGSAADDAASESGPSPLPV